ncbi:hypothetical protein [Psychrobacillus glaciei]|uniref:hypothetical protein n=1 Tax=Psychrobacillus glaciei TaxID=2283160 RepID=UPI00178C3C00|nr:hypothetical protein [Psychrobacillus glaciei]
MTTVKGKNSLTDEELEIIVRFVEMFSILTRDTKKAPAATGAIEKTYSEIL